jgi:hypothetical protein
LLSANGGLFIAAVLPIEQTAAVATDSLLDVQMFIALLRLEPGA